MAKSALIPLLFLALITRAWALSSELSAHLEWCATREGVPSWIVVRLIEAEGMHENQCVENANGTRDHGIMSLNDLTIEDIRKECPDFDPYDERESVAWGCAILARRREIFGNWYDTIGSWNLGVRGWTEYLNEERELPYATRRILEYVFEGGNE